MANRPYKIKHKKSGLYVQPITSNGSNLSKHGKIYQTKTNYLSDYTKDVYLKCKADSNVIKLTMDCIKWNISYSKDGYLYCLLPIEEFEIEYL